MASSVGAVCEKRPDREYLKRCLIVMDTAIKLRLRPMEDRQSNKILSKTHKGPFINTEEQRQYQDVANNNHVSPAIHRSSHASRKTSIADNVDDAESVGADGAEGGED
ncbi:hypothetical protein CJ030_MR6G001566 [Morella rubra]|uniref:Uncharacterized protein n=1 Tax=Morella rubra TaxID=262757 RepID=A0A6A1VA88_9ROSI|nr:hypothetical protein CJ030_MR6G001566 [Morella rubra]